ncbi:MAG: leucine-rich repeat domain-containing protein [Peptococcaceae bacterium]|nr:leucine-rich repeat domain-containing protein [Peptococcaceae bacterium]
MPLGHFLYPKPLETESGGSNIKQGCHQNYGGGLTSIGYESFSHCDSLTSVTLPSSVTSIGWCAFLNCGSLSSIEIPDSVTHIANGAFGGCPLLSDQTKQRILQINPKGL